MTDKSKADDNVADAEKAVTDAVAKAQSDAKARIKAITECEDAKGREALARHFAFDTDLAPEAAIAAMKAAPSAQAAPADPVADYETQRLAASGMAVPGSGTPPKARAALSQSAIFAARRAATSKGE